jgi:phosphonate transport system substrate-binding protein
MLSRSSSNRRKFLAAAGLATAGLSARRFLQPALAQTKRLRFGVGPLLPTPDDTKKAYTPIFAYLAKQLDVDFDLTATNDWAGIAVAMGSGQLDVAWMGPWGYVIANNATGCQAVATAKYDENPCTMRSSSLVPICRSRNFPTTPRGGRSPSRMSGRRRDG